MDAVYSSYRRKTPSGWGDRRVTEQGRNTRMTTAQFVHIKVVENLRRMAQDPDPQVAHQAARKLAEVLDFGRAKGWNK